MRKIKKLGRGQMETREGPSVTADDDVRPNNRCPTASIKKGRLA